MDETKRLRNQAWAGLVDQVAPRSTPSDVLRLHPTVARRSREARASAKMARQSLARVLVAIEAKPKDSDQLQLMRAWSGCVDEILALTERLCGLVAAA